MDTLTVLGFNGECIDGKCDCIRNGAQECVDSEPPQKCHPNQVLPCTGNLICDSDYNICTCGAGTVILGSQCISTTSVDGSGSNFECRLTITLNRVDS